MPEAIASALLPELEHEASNTRRVLERVPLENGAWKPHERSMTLAHLATHLAEIYRWGNATLTSDFVDVAQEEPPEEARDRASLLATFDRNVASAREALAQTGDQAMMQPWKLVHGEHTLFELPRVAAVRGFVLNHAIHHRGQLTVYLRLLDVPLPAIYGPSADEDGS